MSIRLLALYIMVAGVCIYAWKDWFKSLCLLILVMVGINHPDMPTEILGIQGLNLWNLLFGMILVAWLTSRRSEGCTWGMPRHVLVLLLLYLCVIIVGFLRAAFDRSHIEDYSMGSLISEELVNTIKWALPGVLLFDGCRTRRRVVMALVCLLALYAMIGVQVVKAMPLRAAMSDAWAMGHYRSKLNELIGYHCTDLSVLLGGASWGMLAALALSRRKGLRLLTLAATGIITFGQAQTGGRGGYVAWGATGLVLCILKWRRLLLLGPVFVVLVPIIFPVVAARMVQGFGTADITGQSTMDLEGAVTSGRWVFWPHVIHKISESPWVGYGRLAMKRTGLQKYLATEYGESEAVAHPHNMYMETLLDNGVLGSAPILLFFVLMVIYSAGLFRSSNHLYSAVGGLSLALTLSSLFGGISGQHFYPQEHTLGIWAAIFLSLRVHVEEKRAQMASLSGEPLWDQPST